MDIDDIVITPELYRRPRRPADYQMENRALVALAGEMAHNPRNLLQKLVDIAVELCNAGSAGISLLKRNDEGEYFQWEALSGVYAGYVGGTTPRDFSPCGTTIDRGEPQLFFCPARLFIYLNQAETPIIEGLVVPFRAGGDIVGTIWIVAHNDARRFDAEDARIMSSLAAFTAAALRTLRSADAAMRANDELWRTTEALHESEQWRRIAQSAAGIGMFDWNIQSGTIRCTESYPLLYGMAAGEPIAPLDAMLPHVHPDDRDQARADLSGAIDGAVSYHSEFRVVWPDGSIHWLGSSGEVLVDDAGRPMRLVGATSEITELKLAEEGLKEADRRKDEFLATLAHELRNPLAPICNALEIMQMGDDEFAPQALEIIERQVGHMARLVDDLLELSRISRGSLELRVERVNLADVINDAVETSRPLMESARHNLAVEFTDEPLMLDADPMRISQVVSNLLNNAAKYTDQRGAIRLAIGREGTEAVIRVRDNGIGIAAEMLPKIFEMFAQVDRSLRRARGGLGIGLTLVNNLVRMHGGRVEAKSEGLGKGSEFIVRLPLAPETEN